MLFPSFTFSGSEYRPASGLVRGFGLGSVLLALLAVAIGTWPASATVGAEYAIVFVHVPAAWLSLLLYAAAAGCAALMLSQPGRGPANALQAIAPVGVVASLVALWSGLAGQRALGVWWGWDARLVCELVLLVLYAGAIALRTAIAEPARADRAAAVLVLVGALNIPIIYLSVNWWHTLHERAAASVGRSSFSIAAMVVMTLAFCMVAGAVVMARLQSGAPKEQQ
ncbi:MAG TPA: cytochrome c biogenesis protein CcsA [Ramlibacter sp.]|nr:cytochrome c biogenesis protein CcsA [Ramlibacter sp.]